MVGFVSSDSQNTDIGLGQGDSQRSVDASHFKIKCAFNLDAAPVAVSLDIIRDILLQAGDGEFIVRARQRNEVVSHESPIRNMPIGFEMAHGIFLAKRPEISTTNLLSFCTKHLWC